MRDEDFWVHEGKNYLRVTAAIKNGDEFDRIPSAVLHKKQVMGTNVHQAIDDDLRGDLPLGLMPGCLGYFQSYRVWRDRVNLSVLQNEQRYFDDELMLTGCIDLLAKLPYEDTPVIIDWKTSATESASWILQSHLYGYLLAKNNIAISKRYIFVKLHPLGATPDIFEYLYSPNSYRDAINRVKRYWKKHEKSCEKVTFSDKIVVK